MRKALFLFTLLSISIAALAGKPRITPGLNPGINDGEGNTTGGGNNTEVNLPIGLPETGTDAPAPVDPSGTSNIVYTFDLSDENGASSVNQTHSALEKARDMNAKCVLIRINSFAGGWDAAENIRQELLGYDRPVMVYVNNQAIPAATFISSGADSIYTKKGSKIANNKSKNKTQINGSASSKQDNILPRQEVAAQSNPDDEFSDAASMNEILFKAGLSNLTVVEHNPSFIERAADLLMNPYVVLAILLLIGFIMRRASASKLPGPILYVLVASVILYIAPFQSSGLASNAEIIAGVVLIAGVIMAARNNVRWLTAVLLIALSFVFVLIRTGDMQVLWQHESYNELLSLSSLPLGIVVLGWCLGMQRTRADRKDKESSAGTLRAEAV